MKTTWRAEIAKEAGSEPLIACTLTDEELDRPFDAGYGGSEGKPFTAWTETRVIFPAVYDGSEWAASAPRNPCEEATEHVGGQ